VGGGPRIAPANDTPPVFFHAGVRGSFHRLVSPRPSFGGFAAEGVLAGGFPRVLFPPLWCFPPRCAGAVPPCGLLTPVALLSCVHLLSLRASACQTWAGSSLADAGAPQLHALAPLQQRRWPARRPAHVNPPPSPLFIAYNIAQYIFPTTPFIAIKYCQNRVRAKLHCSAAIAIAIAIYKYINIRIRIRIER